MRSAKIESLFQIALLFSITACTFAQTSSTQPIGRVRGLVTDKQGARIIQAKGVFKGITKIYEVKVNEEGEYNIELPAGSYIARFSSEGFCSSSSILIKAEPNQITNFDCELRALGSHVECDPPNVKFERLGTRTGELYTNVYIWYGESKTTEEWFEYRTSAPSQNALKVYFRGMRVWADEKISLHRFSHRIKAEGNVLIENGDTTIQAKYAEFDYTKENPILLLKN